MPAPLDASSHQWTWLSLSGLVGFVIGDFCLSQAFIMIGARVAMLIMTLAPLIAAFTGWYFLGDTFSANSIIGMLIVMRGKLS